MRLYVFLTLVFALLISITLAQITETEPGTITLVPEPEPEPTPTESEQFTDPVVTEVTRTAIDPTITPVFSSTSTETEDTFYTSVGTAAPPSGGGATCVQICLSQAAAQIGCSSSADVSCTCGNAGYMDNAQTCFSVNNCDSSAISNALRDVSIICRAAVTTSQGGQATPNPPSPTASRTSQGSISRPASVTSLTTQRLVLTSGAIITISGTPTTIASGFTTVRTGEVREIATGAAAASSIGVSGGTSSSNGAGARWNLVGSMLVTIVFGGAVTLL